MDLEGPAQLQGLKSGQLVEVAGEYVGNPLEDMLALFGSIIPYMLDQQQKQQEALKSALEGTDGPQAEPGPGSKPPSSQTPQPDVSELLEGLVQQTENAEAELGAAMVLRMVEDIQRVPVHDLLLRTTSGLQVVLTVASDYYSAATNENLRAGEFRVVGKVTRTLTGEKKINLTRRTVLGVANPSTAQEIMASFKTDKIDLDLADPIVTAPAVQVLPMAIFL